MGMYSELAQILKGFDRIATENYYKDQLTAKENCSCDSCVYYEDVFLKKGLNIFSFLTELGIDVRKDEDSDPEGLWLVLGDENEFIQCYSAHAVFGEFTKLENQELSHQFDEGDIRINTQIVWISENRILLYVDYRSIENIVLPSENKPKKSFISRMFANFRR